MAKTCCVSSCKTLPEAEKFYYNFPVNFDLCMQWVQNLGDKSLWQEFQYGGAYPFLQRTVCSNHFLDIDFKVFGDRNSGLRKDVLPCDGPVKPEYLTPEQLSTGVLLPVIKAVVEPIIENCSIKVEEDPDRLQTVSPSKLHLLQQLNILSTKDEDVEAQETKIIDQSSDTMQKVAKHGAVKVKSCETEEQKQARLENSRIRTAEKRKSMTQEEKALWREKNRIQTRQRRQNEDEVTKVMRRYNNAVRASTKRSRESEEQRMERRYRDALRAAEKRRCETSQERQTRLMKDRERVAQKRMEIKMTETPEQKEARLHKGREQVYKGRHSIPKTIKETPEVLSILKSINEHLSQINQPINLDNVANFVKASHPDLNDSYVNNVVGSVFNEEDSNECVELTDISHSNASLEREENYESSYSDSVNENTELPEVSDSRELAVS